MEIRPVGAKSIHAEGRTEGQADVTKLMAAFRNCAKAPNNV